MVAELRKDCSVFHPDVDVFESDSNDWIETLELFFILPSPLSQSSFRILSISRAKSAKLLGKKKEESPIIKK